MGRVEEGRRKGRKREEEVWIRKGKYREVTKAFFFNDTATTEIYTLSLHDALPISNVLSTLLLLPFAIWVGGEISLENWGWVALMGIVGFGAQFCYISAMSVGEASFISPVDYLRLPMSSVADFFVFRVVPGVNVWIGAAIIVVSTLYIGARERLKSK